MLHKWCFSERAGIIKRNVCLIAVFTALLAANLQAGTYSGGTGEPNNPYRIANANDMNEIGTHTGDWGKHFKLMADIDMSGYAGTEFNRIGTDPNPFTGVFDGNGYEISDFTYEGSGGVIGSGGGIFAYISGDNAEVRDLILRNPDVGGWQNVVGALVGRLKNGGTISGCSVEGGSVSGPQMVGGMVGAVDEGTIVNCHSSATVFGAYENSSNVGGLIGYNNIGSVTNCYSTGNIIFSGIDGYGEVGGLSGDNSGTITGCYSTGEITGVGEDVGGLVGDNKNSGIISNCYSQGDVEGVETVGGLVGLNFGNINNSYAMGAVSGDSRVGGLVGMNVLVGPGSISKCYSTGIVTGNLSVGGLVGYKASGTVGHSFWDIQTSEQWSSDGGTGKITTEMQTESTFTSVGWDFATPVWRIYEGADYPRLEWEPLRPIADAGPDQAMSTIPGLITLDGSGSYDPEGKPLTYYWQQVDGPAVGLSDPCTASPTFSPSEFGMYVFKLVVNNGIVDSFANMVEIDINNYIPIANAGPDQSMSVVPELVTLDGSGSYDPLGDPLAGYYWQQIDGPAVVLSDPCVVEATFVPSEFGVYVFELIVNDGVLDSYPDVVGIVIGNNHAPVAEAGLPRYAAQDPVILDGIGSYDPDGYGIISYEWQQISGPTVVITDANMAMPTISDFTQTSSIQECEFGLVVSDGELISELDTVKVIIVPAFNNSSMYLKNNYFDSDKPTIITFDGGNCSSGGGFGFGHDSWASMANMINFSYYEPPYERCGDMLIVFLSKMAPDYKQPIQTMGHSTGGMPAIDVAKYLNLTYIDARYAVNRVSFFDTGCRDFSQSISDYLDSRVDDEQCWVDNYFVNPKTYPACWGEYMPYTLNVRFTNPPADHLTPRNWYTDSLDPNKWPSSDIYAGGISAGAYWSVIGPGKNLQLASDSTYYYFKWIDDDPDYLEFYNESSYPGRLPEPVTLIGPADGNTVDANGAVFSCEISENAVGYQLLIGPDSQHVDLVISDTPTPPTDIITLFLFEKTWWTIKAYDQYGSTIHADPICFVPNNIIADFTGDLFVNFADFCVLAKEWRKDGDSLRMDLVKDNTINELDLAAFGQQWLITDYLWLNPFAHWKLDSDASDYSGNGYDGTIYGDPNWVAGQIDGALDLDGMDDYVDTNSADLGLEGTDTITVSAWIYPRSVTGDTGYIINDYDKNFRRGWLVDFASTNTFRATNLSFGKSRKRQSSVLALDQWHHVVAVIYPADYPDIYVNGQLDNNPLASGNPTTELYMGSGNVMIGRQSNPDERYFNGIIDYVRIYDRAISTAEILKLYQDGISP